MDHVWTIRTIRYVDTSLVVQWLGLHASTASSLGSIPSRGTKIPKAEQHSRKEKKSAFPGYREDQVEPSWGVHCLTY